MTTTPNGNANKSAPKSRADSDDRRGKGKKGEQSGKPNSKHGNGKPQQAAPAPRVETMRTVVERFAGGTITKVSQINRTTFVASNVKYLVEFTGCEPIEFGYLAPARERAKQPAPAPEAASTEEAAADAAASTEASAAPEALADTA